MTRWTKKEVELARHISAGQQKKSWVNAFTGLDLANQELPTKKELEDFFRMINNAPIVPPDPPWWEQAVAWADQGLVWVRGGGGWMSESLWEGCLKDQKTTKS